MTPHAYAFLKRLARDAEKAGGADGTKYTGSWTAPHAAPRRGRRLRRSRGNRHGHQPAEAVGHGALLWPRPRLEARRAVTRAALTCGHRI